MFDTLKNTFKNLKIDSHSGKFFADKSYKYDVFCYMVQYIVNNSNGGTFNYNYHRSNVERYTVEKFTLNPDSDGNLNFMNETLNLLEFAKLIKNNGFVYEITSSNVLKFISQSMENAYIVQYMIAYYTFKNSDLLDDYTKYVKCSDISRKKLYLNALYLKICELSPSVEEEETVWAKLFTKYPVMILGYANNEYAVSRELNVTKKKMNGFSLSANVNNPKTRPEFYKTNDYSENFDINYVRSFLKTILIN